ncbi:MAG: hypothetical protein KIG36_02990 [Eubacteriales bacterium]|nr:hypothetical protein [Eubacteriales bacterium]
MKKLIPLLAILLCASFLFASLAVADIVVGEDTATGFGPIHTPQPATPKPAPTPAPKLASFTVRNTLDSWTNVSSITTSYTSSSTGTQSAALLNENGDKRVRVTNTHADTLEILRFGTTGLGNPRSVLGRDPFGVGFRVRTGDAAVSIGLSVAPEATDHATCTTRYLYDTDGRLVASGGGILIPSDFEGYFVMGRGGGWNVNVAQYLLWTSVDVDGGWFDVDDFGWFADDPDNQGVALSGAVTVPGMADVPVLAELKSGETIVSRATGVGGYTLFHVQPGDYVLTLSAETCAQRAYPVSIANADRTLDAVLWRFGDLNGDGRVNATDNTLLLRHIKGTQSLTDYALACADITGDERANASDNTALLRHIKGTRPLYTTPVLAAPSAQVDQADEYAYMWFRSGADASSDRQLYVKTGRYGFGFDTNAIRFTRLGAAAGNAEDDLVLSDSVVDAMHAASSSLIVYTGSTAHSLVTGNGYDTTRIVTMGSERQSFYTDSISVSGVSGLNARVEVNALTDYFSVYYDVSSSTEINNLRFSLSFNTGNSALTTATWYRNNPSSGILTLSGGGEAVTFVLPAKNDGVSRSLTISSAGVVMVNTSYLTSPARTTQTQLMKKRTYAVGLIVIPGLNDPAAAAYLLDPASAVLSAEELAPVAGRLRTEYDALTGTYDVTLRAGGFSGDLFSPTLERVLLSAVNATAAPRRLHVMLTHRANEAVNVVGGVPMLRDTDGVPTGKTVQVSKNWHAKAETPLLYDSQWQRFYLSLALPGSDRPVTNEFTVAYQTWGGALAASHTQLCLIGWSSATALQWDEAAVGAYTETICFAPDSGNTSFINDVRGVLVKTNGAVSGFASNVGGGDFLLYITPSGNRITAKDLRTRYLSHGPNLSVVTYTGRTTDDSISFVYTVKVCRGNDLTRVYLSFDYSFLKAVSARTLSLFCYGTEKYNESGFTGFAVGNSAGLVKEYTSSELSQGTNTYSYQYVTGFVPLTGDDPWLSWTGTRSGVVDGFGHADRALILRDWSATVRGVENDTPYLRIRSARAHHQGSAVPTNIMELGGGTNSYYAGDRVRGTVELLVLPQTVSDYAGSDAAFLTALNQYAGSWQLAHYEATAGAVAVSGLSGATLAATAPTVLRAKTGTTSVSFTLSGGVSYVPVTFTNLATNRGWRLQEHVDGVWTDVAASQEVYGNDFWQCRSDPVSGTYELTYNVYRSSGEARAFRLVQSLALALNPDPTEAQAPAPLSSLPTFFQEERPYAETVLNVPTVQELPEYNFSDEIKAVAYRGADYGTGASARQTRVFAYLGVPASASPTNPCPAVVLVHGGGGTADCYWVKYWVDRGYAAISMDLEGHYPIRNGNYCTPGTETNAYSGPVRVGAFGDADEADLSKQWPYHAVSAIMLARTLIGGLDCVDDGKIGVMGFSWGGYLTSFTITVDNRYAFAIPVYGSAFVGETYLFQNSALSAAARKWDPALNVGNVTAKVLWFNSDKDFFTNLIGDTLSYENTPGSVMLIDPDMGHGGGNCWSRPEVFAFADSVVKGTPGLMEIVRQPEGLTPSIEVSVPSGVTIHSAKLFYRTQEMGYKNTEQTAWLSLDAAVSGTTVSATVPNGAVAYFFVVYDSRVGTDPFMQQQKRFGTASKVVYLVDTHLELVVR